MKAHFSVGLFVLVGFCGGLAAAEPIGPGAGTSSGQTSCDRCAACKKVIGAADKSSPMEDGTTNSQKTGQCKADCADCNIRGEAPASVPANSIDRTKEKQ
jgi:hypothetical protein